MRIYDSAIYGAVFYNTNQADIENLLTNPSVKSIHANLYDIIILPDAPDPDPEPPIYDPNIAVHLDRIDQESNNLDQHYMFNSNEFGQGVNVHIIDSGIRATHIGLVGKVGSMQDFTEENVTPLPPAPNLRNVDSINNFLGHGTSVASVVAGDKYGVAKGVTLHSLKVVNKDNNMNVDGLLEASDTLHRDYTEQNHIYELPAVVNMSIGTQPNDLVTDAIESIISIGITVVVAVGNYENGNCSDQIYPANISGVISVGATEYLEDSLWEGSNWGPCVDLFAPGQVYTNYANTDTEKGQYSGTSFAAPQVAGAAALYLQNHPAALPAQVKAAILNGATRGRLSYFRVSLLLPSDENYFLNVSHLDNNPDEYDNIAIRGYSDDIDGDAEIIAVSTPQSHNFHSSSDVDWTIILPSSVTKNYTYSTQNVGLNSDTDISIYKVTSIVANPNYPNQNRYIINSKQLIVSDNIGETSIDFTAIAGFYYVVKSTSRNGTSGDETTYSAQLTSMTPDAYEDDDSLNLSKQIPINGVF